MPYIHRRRLVYLVLVSKTACFQFEC
jgi:hypothetical protein